MDQERPVCEGRELSKVKYAVQNSQESFLVRDGGVFIAHTPKTSRWKILRTWRSDRSANHGQTAKEVTTTFKSNFRPLEEVAVWPALVAVRPRAIQGLAVWPATPGGQTVSTYFGRQKSISSDKIFQGFQPIQI
jgi:hypothetical protein